MHVLLAAGDAADKGAEGQQSGALPTPPGSGPPSQTAAPKDAGPTPARKGDAASPKAGSKSGARKRKGASAGGSSGGAAAKKPKGPPSTPASKGASKGRKAVAQSLPPQQRTLDAFFKGAGASSAQAAAAAAVAPPIGPGAGKAAAPPRPVIQIPALPRQAAQMAQRPGAGSARAAVKEEDAEEQVCAAGKGDAEQGAGEDLKPDVEDLTGDEQQVAGAKREEGAAGEQHGSSGMREAAGGAPGDQAALAAVKHEEAMDELAGRPGAGRGAGALTEQAAGAGAVKEDAADEGVDEDEGGVMEIKDEDEAGQEEEEEMEEPEVGEDAAEPDQARPLRQMGAFASARAATTGVANALIEKRKSTQAAAAAGGAAGAGKGKGRVSAKAREAAAAAATLVVRPLHAFLLLCPFAWCHEDSPVPYLPL